MIPKHTSLIFCLNTSSDSDLLSSHIFIHDANVLICSKCVCVCVFDVWVELARCVILRCRSPKGFWVPGIVFEISRSLRRAFLPGAASTGLSAFAWAENFGDLHLLL